MPGSWDIDDGGGLNVRAGKDSSETGNLLVLSGLLGSLLNRGTKSTPEEIFLFQRMFSG
jgi:hypothetical protein